MNCSVDYHQSGVYRSSSDGAIAENSKTNAATFSVPAPSKSMSGDPCADEDEGLPTGSMYIPRVASLINLTEYMNR